MDSAPLDLNAVRVFVAVVEHRSFRAAARALGVPKSTVSRRVADLEAQLGAQLLQRTTRTVSLTDVGEAFHQRASVSLSSLGEAVRSVHALNEAPSGVLRMTAPGTFAELFLKDILAGYLEDNPELRVVLDLSDRYVDLVGEGYDLAIRAGVLPDSTLKTRLLTAAPLVCIASPDYLARRGTPTTPADLAAHDCVAYATSERTVSWHFEKGRERATVKVKPRIAVNSWTLVRDLAATGRGIARVPGGLSVNLKSNRTLVAVLVDWQPPPVPLQVVYPAGQHLSPRVRSFIDRLTAELDVPSGGSRR